MTGVRSAARLALAGEEGELARAEGRPAEVHAGGGEPAALRLGGGGPHPGAGEAGRRERRRAQWGGMNGRV